MTEYMKLALEEARIGITNGHGGPFGCVIVKNGEVIGRGHNEVLLRNDSTCHGEIQAIRNACKNTGSFDLEGCELYTTSEPCPMCFGAVQWANIKKVYYGCTVEDAERIGFRDRRFYDQSREELLVSSDREACLALFGEYASSSGKMY